MVKEEDDHDDDRLWTVNKENIPNTNCNISNADHSIYALHSLHWTPIGWWIESLLLRLWSCLDSKTLFMHSV